MSTATSMITVKIENRASRDHQLEQAISLIREQADTCGILVTRVDFTTFTIAASPSIAFGFIHEMDLL